MSFLWVFSLCFVVHSCTYIVSYRIQDAQTVQIADVHSCTLTSRLMTHILLQLLMLIKFLYCLFYYKHESAMEVGQINRSKQVAMIPYSDCMVRRGILREWDPKN